MSAQRTLDIRVITNPGEAPKHLGPEHQPVTIDHVNVVRNGTEAGKTTVDVVLTNDETGQKYAMMITGKLLCALTRVIGDE
jgi:hypothetical protein